MKPRSLFFVTSNSYKFTEFERLFKPFNVKLEHLNYEIEEIQTLDMNKITRDKVIRAYSLVYQPVMVDHSSIAMKALNDLPQGLNHIFWEALKDQVCGLAIRLQNNKAQIISYLGICDGRKIYTVFHKEWGIIATSPSSVGTFHLDRVFIPDGCSMRLSDMIDSERDIRGYRKMVAIKAIELLTTIELGKKLGLK